MMASDFWWLFKTLYKAGVSTPANDLQNSPENPSVLGDFLFLRDFVMSDISLKIRNKMIIQLAVSFQMPPLAL